MVENAKAAQAAGVEMLSIGCEMGNMQVHPDEVRQLINAIRAAYNGLLTYSANHDSYAHVDWWDAVDIIGISMYSMMTIAWDPSITELRTIWDGTYYELEELALKWNRPIAFTEIGIQAKDGSNIIPNDNQISVEKDIDEMRDYYLSLFQSRIWTASWFKGAYWWIWDYQDPATDPDLKDFNPILIKDTIKAEYEKMHVIQPTAFPVFPTLVPLAGGIVMLVLIVKKPGSPVLDSGFSFKKRREEGVEVPAGAEMSPNEMKHNEILLGISIGGLFSTVASSLTIGVYGVIQKSFSYAIILGLSTAEILVTFAAILLLGIVIGLLFLRVLPRYVLIAAFLLLLFYPYLALGNRYQMIFVTTFFDVALLFLFVAAVAVFSIKCKVQNLLRVIIVAVMVAAGFFLLVLAFDTLAIAFLAIPVGLAIQTGRAVRPRSNPRTNPSEMKTGRRKVKIPVQMMFVMNSLIAGMLIPFGNSIINLVRTNFLAVSMHYIPALVAASIILVVVTWWRRSAERARFDWTTIFSNDYMLLSNVILGLGGILFILAGRLLVVWAVVSGMYVIQYFGTLVVNVQRAITRDNIGGGFAYLTVAAICFVLGFMINAIKGLLVYVVTFLTIKDGAIVRRNPAIDPVATFDVPLLLDGLVLGVVIVLVTILIVYRLIVRAWVKQRLLVARNDR